MSQSGKYVKLNLFSKLKTIIKRKGQNEETIRSDWSQMIADNSRIESRKHYHQRKRLYYIVTVNSVFMRNQFFIQNLPEQEEQIIEQPNSQSDESRMIETVQNLDRIQKIVKVRLPTDLVLVVWNIYIMMLIFSQMLLIPLILSFDIVSEGLFVYDWIVNGSFYVDILLQFNTAIYINGNLIQERTIIVKEYLKMWFWIDIISSFPYDIIFDSPQLQSKAQVIKLLRFLKFIKVIRLLRALKLKKIFGRIEEYISVIESLFQFTQMVKLIILILCIAHWCACIWNLFIDGSENNWAYKYKIQNEDWLVKYMTAFYYSMTTIITVGYGDVHAYSVQEMIYAIALMLLASAVFGYTTNIVMELFTNQYDNFLKQEQNIKNYLRRKKIDVSLQSRVTSYLEWLQLSYAKSQQHESTLIESLSANLKSEVICLINSKIISKIPFFDTFSKDLLSNIAYQLQEKVFGPEEIIFEQGQYGDEMYCIVNGSIQVKERYRQTRIARLGKEEIFGEICLFSEKPRSATIITEDFVNLLVLRKEPFLTIIKQLQNDLEKYYQIKYYLEIEEDYSVLDIRCYICSEFHLAINCPLAHLVIDKQHLILQPIQVKCQRTKLRHLHSYKYLRNITHLRALKKLHQGLMKLHLLGRQITPIGYHQYKMENQVIDQIDIDQVKQYDYYVTKGNVDEIILSINLNADIKLKQMEQEKNIKFQQKKSQLSRVRKAIIHNPFLGLLKNVQKHQQQQQLNLLPSPIQAKRNRMNQVKNLRQQSQSHLMKALSRQNDPTQNKIQNNEIEEEEHIQQLKILKIHEFPVKPTRMKRTSSQQKLKSRKLSQQEKKILGAIKQIEMGNKNQNPKEEIKRYSIIHGRPSTIQVPIENVFNIELHQLNKTLNNTKEGEQPSMLFADFCQAKNPSIYLEQLSTLNVCAEQCQIYIKNNKIYSLLPGYLKVLELNQEYGFTFFSETLLQISQNLSQILICINNKEEKNLIIIDGFRLYIINIEQNTEEYKPIQLNSSINHIDQVIYYENLVYLYGGNILEIYSVNDQTIELLRQINLLESLSGNTSHLSNVVSIHLKTPYYLVCHTESSIGFLQFDSLYQLQQASSIHIDGKVTNIQIFDELTYIIQKLNNKMQYVLEYEGMQLKQNLTLTTKVNQIFSTQNYIIILQENLVQLAFAKIESKQLFSKSILENTQKILEYENGILLVQQQNEIVLYEIKQQSAQLLCEPNQNYSTGTYMMELRAGYFVNETQTYRNQLVEVNVYIEIFENGNVGLYVGLTIGLALTFITMIIFCVFFYKLKAKYQFVGDESYHKNSTDFTIE